MRKCCRLCEYFEPFEETSEVYWDDIRTDRFTCDENYPHCKNLDFSYDYCEKFKPFEWEEE